jgi:MFS family permease
LRLGRILAGLAPGESEVHGLVALMEIQASRTHARSDAQGRPVLLLEQDRSRWDPLLIRRGLVALARCEALGGAGGVYALQAALAACHARARTAEETDWARIAALYATLATVAPSPVVELNRAVAVGMAFGAAAGLGIADALRDEASMANYHLLPTVRGDLLAKLGRRERACQEFERAAGDDEERRRAAAAARTRGEPAMTVSAHPVATVAALGSAQTLAWASSYYLPAMLATRWRGNSVSPRRRLCRVLARPPGLGRARPFAGRAIDRWGGRPVLIGSNLVFALGWRASAWHAAVRHVRRLGAARRRHGQRPVRGGVRGAGAPTRPRLAQPDHRHHADRRLRQHRRLAADDTARAGARLARRLLRLGAAPPRARCPAQCLPAARDGRWPRRLRPVAGRRPAVADIASRRRAALILSFVFAVTWFVSTAMAAHLPRLLQAGGATLAAAVAIGALVGPAQVGGRLLEFGVLRHVHPLLSARLAALMHPVGAAVLALLGAPAAAVFAILHGAGNGILTIAKGPCRSSCSGRRVTACVRVC